MNLGAEDGVEPGHVWQIVIATHPGADLTTRDMEDDDFEAHEREQEAAERREHAAEGERAHHDRVQAAADIARTAPELPANVYCPDWD